MCSSCYGLVPVVEPFAFTFKGFTPALTPACAAVAAAVAAAARASLCDATAASKASAAARAFMEVCTPMFESAPSGFEMGFLHTRTLSTFRAQDSGAAGVHQVGYH